MSPRIRSLSPQLLSRSWSTLQKFTYEYQLPDGSWETQVREAYDRGDGVCALLINKIKKTVILTRQFRLPTYLNGNPDGMLTEVCAGKLNRGEDPVDGMRREIEEETGHRILKLEKVFETYMSPGSVTEVITMFLGQYDETTRVSKGGGLEEEGENIEVIELPFQEALEDVRTGKIRDAKTIMLLQYLALHQDKLS